MNNIVELPIKKIVERLSSLNLHNSQRVVADDLQNPKPERLQIIYDVFLQDIVNCNMSDKIESFIDANICDSEQHSNTAFLCLLNQAMSSFLTDFTGGQLSFSVCDLVRPDPRRTKQIFSVMANLLEYRELYQQDFDTVWEAQEEKKKALAEIEEEVNFMDDKKQKLIDKQDARKRRENEVLCELEQHKKQLQNSCREFSESEKCLNTIKESIDTSRAQIEKMEMMYENLEKEAVRLSESILNSPDEFIAELNLKKTKLAEMKASYEQSKIQLASVRQEIQLCSRSDQELQALYNGIEKLLGEEEKVSQAVETLRQQNRAHKQLQTKLQEFMDHNSAKEKSVEETANKFVETQKEHEERMKHLDTVVEELTREVEQFKTGKKSVSIEERNEMMKCIKETEVARQLEITNARRELNKMYQSLDYLQKVHAQKRDEFLQASGYLEGFLGEAKCAINL